MVLRYLVWIVAGFLLLLTVSSELRAQLLHPGFDPGEYRELLLVSAHSSGLPEYDNGSAYPALYERVYSSPEFGLDNHWQLWMHKEEPIAVLSLRGTMPTSLSWLANFYAAMVPASGNITLPDSTEFEYELSQHKHAAVHVGWLLSLAFLSEDILFKTDSLLEAGVRNFFIVGHSQGGAIAYLLRAWFAQQQTRGRIPSDIYIKTYCSAAPKPGNLYYAYTFEQMNYGGWAYNVVNTFDWVPEVPVSIQTLDDYNTPNPFIYAPAAIKKQSFPKDVLLMQVFKKLKRKPEQAQRIYEKYLGCKLGKQVQKSLGKVELPAYSPTNHYVRTGATILLIPDAHYQQLYPSDTSQVFIHHSHHAYLYLLDKQTW